VRRQDQLRTLQTERGRHWRVQRKLNPELIIIIIGAILGFAILIALMVYFSW
jgi:hypothetical protein